MEFVNFRMGNIELRATGKYLTKSDNIETCEIIHWEESGTGQPSCYILAYWIESKEGFDLKFVGDRPFGVSHSTFMHMAKFGQEILDEYFASRVENG